MHCLNDSIDRENTVVCRFNLCFNIYVLSDVVNVFSAEEYQTYDFTRLEDNNIQSCISNRFTQCDSFHLLLFKLQVNGSINPFNCFVFHGNS